MSKRLNSALFSMSLKQILTMVILLGSLLVGTTLAQVLYGTLTGNVTDPSGAAVASARVTAVNINTGVTNEATVNEDGVYRFQALQAGTYKVSIAALNFATQVSERIRSCREPNRSCGWPTQGGPAEGHGNRHWGSSTIANR